MGSAQMRSHVDYHGLSRYSAVKEFHTEVYSRDLVFSTVMSILEKSKPVKREQSKEGMIDIAH